ncbi:MAG: PilN domain-containing protein [Acidiferrobacterales bacterium]
MTRLNLLPWRQMRRKEQDRQLLSVGVGAAILMLLILFYAYLNVTGRIDNQNKRNLYLTAEIKKLDGQIAAIKELKKQRDALIARMQVIEQLQSDRTQIVHVFDDLVRKLPEGVYLTSFQQSGMNITLSGVAQSNARVSALMRNLDSSNWFANPDLDVINVTAQGNDRVSQFTLHVTETDKSAKTKGSGP